MADLDLVQLLARIVGDLPAAEGKLAADLGCGAGQRGARVLAELGWTVYGCELDPAKAELAGSFGKIDVCDVRSWAPPEAVDLVLCAELLEHLPSDDQQPLLEEVRRWLRPGGHLVLSTPQRNSPVALVERAYSSLRHRGAYDWWDPTHVSVLRRSRLEALFARVGFVVKRRLGIHLVPELVPLPRLHRTVHEGPLGALGFDLIYVLA